MEIEIMPLQYRRYMSQHILFLRKYMKCIDKQPVTTQMKPKYDIWKFSQSLYPIIIKQHIPLSA